MARDKQSDKRFLAAVSAGYDPGSEFAFQVKENWKHASKQYFESIVRDLSPEKANVWFSAGGPACSGDIHMQVWKNNRGLHIFGNIDGLASGGEPWFVCRTIKYMGDYYGGANTILRKPGMEREALLFILRKALVGEAVGL